MTRKSELSDAFVSWRIVDEFAPLGFRWPDEGVMIGSEVNVLTSYL